ncbi:MAG: accessory factor UbiK family protein [Chromatiales bacterium]|jgi:BMFP domain-containing protein YqiC
MTGTRPSFSDPKVLDDLARRLAESLPQGVQMLQQDAERSLRAALEAALRRMDLVTREELEVQAGVLARTREKLEALQQRIDELERRGRAPDPRPDK